MNKLLIFGIAITIVACQPQGKIDTSIDTELSTQLDTVSYLLGYNYAKGLKTNTGLTELDRTSFLTAMQRVFEDKESEISDEFASDYMNNYFTELKKEQSAVVRQEGDAYLAENMTKEGVQVTESGLQYKVITEGSGAVPKEGDKVKVHYTGKLIDGNVFDSSVERGQPSEFVTNQVIKGWSEALLLMNVGSKWELAIPADLAYGDRATGPIPAGSTLLFEVELLDIVAQ
jgi:FKBP-type peptidyl-prolyl cis-trans isomerase FklB